MNISKSYSSKVSFSRLLWDNKVLRFMIVLSKSNNDATMRLVWALRRKIPRWIHCEGIKTVASRIKDSERSYLLNGTTKWASSRHFCAEGVTSLMTKFLFSIHRNMFVVPQIDLRSIQYEGGDVQRFLETYKDAIDKVVSYKFLRFPYHLLGDYKVLKGGFNPEFPRLGNLTNDITIDSNNRTGGMEFPVRVSLSGGPNGSPLTSQKQDFMALHRYPSVWEAIRKLWFYLDMNLQDNYDPNEITDLSYIPIISKVMGIQDRSCKTRVVALLDSYSQIALRPFHMMMDEVLRKIPKDFTFNHFGGVEYLCNRDYDMVSVDISSATDTIPFSLSLFILRSLLRKCRKSDLSDSDYDCIIDSIKTVMTERPFHNGRDPVFYKTGQPMGAYSSFPLLALTNHFLVRLASYLEKRPRIPYAVVGDDIVICDYQVADRYMSLLNELKIPINYTKTIRGRRTFEFCRRIVVDGKLQSVPSWNSFYSSLSRKDPIPMLTLLTQYKIDIPRYEILCKYFDVKTLRATLAFQEFIIPGGPKSIVRIPNEVKSHAEKLLSVEKLLARADEATLSDDPFIKRLDYCITIQSLYRSNIKKGIKKKKNLWEILTEIRANTFYLGYLQTLRDRTRLNRELRSYYNKQASRTTRVRELCMRFRAKWNLVIKS